MTGDPHLLLGGYVLGGLERADRLAFEAHLRDCARCRDDLGAVASVPTHLRRVAGVPGIPPAAGPAAASLVTLLSTARARRRRRVGRWVAGVAAGLVAVAAGGTAVVMTGQRPAGGRSVAVAGGAVSGRVGLTNRVWGTAVAVKLADLPRSGTFVLRVTDDRGRTESAATWAATPDGAAALSGTTSIRVGHVRLVSVDRPDATVIAVAAVPAPT